VHESNDSVYGVRKVHAAPRRDGLGVGRDRVARLMRQFGLQGVCRGKVKRTTVAGDPADLVQRWFTAQEHVPSSVEPRWRPRDRQAAVLF
jgi:putative transposase